MTTARKILAWALIALIALPAFMVFNDNAETSYINLIGMAYVFLLARYGGRLLPQWVMECLKSPSEEGGDFID